MFGMKTFLLELALAAGPALAAVSGSLSCPADTPLSCHNTTAYDNTCCFNYPGGQVLLTQFWDTSPSTGPATSWTVHGLWYLFPLLRLPAPGSCGHRLVCPP